MNDFFRFPHTPHLTWLGEGSPRDDKVLSPVEATALLKSSVVVEEKLDGANLGISLTPDNNLQAQNRGQYLVEPYSGQFARLPSWLIQHLENLRAVLKPQLILFGEWCTARHSLDYAALPDWFLLFDVYDRAEGRFWSTTRRNALAVEAGLETVPLVFHGKATIADLKRIVTTTPSQYRSGPLEGIVIRGESSTWCKARAKLVHPDFTQAIDSHWRKREIEWNHLQQVVPSQKD